MARKRGIKAAVRQTLAKADRSIDETTDKVVELIGEILDGLSIETKINVLKGTATSRIVFLEEEDDAAEKT